MQLDQTATFVAVVRAGSFTEAARRLGLPKSTVSRQLQRLEARLDARLLMRTSRRIALTEIGRAYFDRCARAVDEIQDAERAAADAQTAPRGLLRVSAPFDFARDSLCHWLPEFRRRWPAVQLSLVVTQRAVDLVAEGFDVALRGGALTDSSLIARKLMSSELFLCASPKYLRAHGTPRSVPDLAQHALMVFATDPSSARWTLRSARGVESLPDGAWFAVNDLSMLQEAARAGLGVALVESNRVAEDLARRRLVRVLPEHAVQGAGFFAVYPSTHHLSAKVRVFVDFVAAKLAAPPGARGSRVDS